MKFIKRSLVIVCPPLIVILAPPMSDCVRGLLLHAASTQYGANQRLGQRKAIDNLRDRVAAIGHTTVRFVDAKKKEAAKIALIGWRPVGGETND